MYKVLLTTSGTGSRLGNITKFTNKSLVRVGKKPSISYIIEQYPSDVEFVVTLGYFGSQVKDFLELAYPNKKFTFVEIDKYEGEGSSLLYSISKTEKYLQEPFIFHACDTITFDEILPPTQNWLAGCSSGDPSQYRSFNTLNDKVICLNEKGESNCNYYYMGICGIKDYEFFWDRLKTILKENAKEQSLSDCHVIRDLLLHKDVTYKEFTSWLDIGNMKGLSHARTHINDEFHILDKDDESIFIFENFVIKFFYDKKTCLNRVKRGDILYPYAPKMLGYRDNFYKYEYAKGDLLSRAATEENIEKLINWASACIWNTKTNEEFEKICEDFYIKKTEKRLLDFYNKNNIKDCSETINGYKIPPLFDLLGRAKEILLKDCIPTGFHGDFILDNILIDKDNFILLDWRQDFGGKIDIGDMYYDLSKLNHNFIVNHDIVNNNLFTINIDKNNISCDILCHYNLIKCQQRFLDIVNKKGFNIKKIKILTSIIWLNMSPLHEYKVGLFLYYFGKYNLWRTLNV